MMHVFPLNIRSPMMWSFFSRILRDRKIAFLNKIGAYCYMKGDNLAEIKWNALKTKLKVKLINSHLKKARDYTSDEINRLLFFKSNFLKSMSRDLWSNSKSVSALYYRVYSIAIKLFLYVK
ncbi:MAG: hypothetical protein ACJA0H_002064 [Francisellaceae bacterium]|jgi:hypothetical protein